MAQPPVGNVGRDSVSGSLDPFKPFHRRFTRLHNAATLIKINYTLASVRSFIRRIPRPLPRARVFSPSFRRFFSPFCHRTFDHQAARHRARRPTPFPPVPSPTLAPHPSLVYLHFIRDLIYRPPGDRLVAARSTL